MNSSLDDDDRRLLAAASDLIIRAHDANLHRVAAAARAASGAIYLGLSLRTARESVCAESTALANARIGGEQEIEAIVSVGLRDDGTTVILNPCGVCREVVPAIAPGIRTLVDDDSRPVWVTADELLPMPWVRARTYD